MSGARTVRFTRRETLPFAGMLLRFGTLQTGDRTWSVVVEGFEDRPPVHCGFWDASTPDELEEIARAMRFALDTEGTDHGEKHNDAR